MGDCPDWYALFVAADVLHCPPWQVLEQSIWWQQKAHMKNDAEIHARNLKAQHGR